MEEKAISVTVAARNFADCVSRVHYQSTSFVLLKNGHPVARLVPGKEKVCSGSSLAAALARVTLPSTEFKAWHSDLKTARKALRRPADKWQ